MRSLDERMAEIYRRSEIAFQKQRRLRKMLITYIPTGLCVVLLLLVAIMPVGGADKQEQTSDLIATKESEATGDKTLVSIEVIGSGVTMCHTQIERLDNICRIINRVLEETYENEEGDPYISSGSSLGENSVGREDKYEIVFIYADGQNEKYVFSGRCITELTTKGQYMISREDAQSLLFELGILERD